MSGKRKSQRARWTDGRTGCDFVRAATSPADKFCALGSVVAAAFDDARGGHEAKVLSALLVQDTVKEGLDGVPVPSES